MRSVESSAKTMEEAVTQGLEKLGVSFADVKIDILDEGSKGFLGILGGKPVVVRLTVREDAEGGEDVLSSVGLEEAVKEPEQKPARKRAPKAKAEKPAAEAKPEKPAEPEKPQEPVHVEFEGEPTPAEMHASDPVEEIEAEQPTEE